MYTDLFNSTEPFSAPVLSGYGMAEKHKTELERTHPLLDQVHFRMHLNILILAQSINLVGFSYSRIGYEKDPARIARNPIVILIAVAKGTVAKEEAEIAVSKIGRELRG